MKTTCIGTYLETFMDSFKTWTDRFNVLYSSHESESFDDFTLLDYIGSYGNQRIFKDVTSISSYKVQGNILGYEDFVLFTRDNGQDLLAVEILNPSDSLISTISSIGMFNGVPIYKIVEQHNDFFIEENFKCLIVFDY